MKGSRLVIATMLVSGIYCSTAIAGPFGATPLMDAASRGDNSTIKRLLSKGAKLDARDDEGKTALMKALYEGHSGTARLLISRGANVNARQENGITPLYISVIHCDPTIVKLLLSKGARVNVADEYGETPLKRAMDIQGDGLQGDALKGRQAIIQLLKKHGAR